MNIYFTPTKWNELKFPTTRLSINSMAEIDEPTKLNNDVDEDLDREEIKMSQFYEKYISKNKNFDKTESQIKLNKKKVFVIVKSKIVEGKEIKYAVPIRSFDDLGNSIVERSQAFIASIFYVKVDNNLNAFGSGEGSPGARPFRLNHLIESQPPFEAEEEFPLENLMLPRKYRPDDKELVKDSDVEDVRPVFIKLQNALGQWQTFFYFLSEYEYDESMLDNTFLANSSRYITDIRPKISLNGEQVGTGFINRLKDFTQNEGFLKLFTISNIVSLILGDPSSLMDKNIIPVFSSLEDAQDLLITTLEEIHQPFQVRRKIENSTMSQYPQSLTYLDDSFSFQNHNFISDSDAKSTSDRIKEVLEGLYRDKSNNLLSESTDEFYSENKYQTKGPFFLEDTESTDNDVYVPMSQRPKSGPKCIWRETDYWSFLNYYFPSQPEEYSWWESRDMTDVDKGLLKKSQDIKIISMGLGDFLEFWNSPSQKNAEVLFIPSSKDFNSFTKKTSVLLGKKPRDKFYEYQQKFRESKKQNTDKYTYEIKVSSE